MTLKKKSLLLIALIGLIFAFVVPRYAPGRGKLDFLRYWAAAHLFVTGGNAYDSQALRSVEMEVSPDSFVEKNSEEDVVEAWNPPWMLVVLIPLGFLPFQAATAIWVFCNAVIIGYSSWLAYEIAGGGDDEKGLALLLGAAFWFSSTILLIQIGQISSLLLLALCLFTSFIQRKMDYWAGSVLLLLSFKPHVSYLLLLTIGIWVLRNRRWGVIAGGFLAFMSSLAVSFIFSPGWPQHYFAKVSELPFNQLSTSTIGSLIELLTGISWFKYVGILLLPAAYLYARNVERLGWLVTINFIMLLSLPASVYGFSFDQVVFLPAVAEAIVWLRQDTLDPQKKTLVVGGIIAVYALAILVRFIPDVVYAWTVLPAILLLIVYNFAWKARRVSVFNDTQGGTSHAFNDPI